MTRIGIVGAGSMGAVHAGAWDLLDADLVGVTAAEPDIAEALATRHGARSFPNVSSLLAEVDVLDVCAPTHLHAEMVLAAADAGVHVICEKPLARSVEQGAQARAACEHAGVRLLVAHVVRFFPEYAAARDAVLRGAIGQPAIVRLARNSFQPRKAANNWFLDETKSGGLVFDLMIHDLDYARWIAGDVASVYARSIKQAHPDAPVDHALAILRHRSGALSHVEASWAHPPPTFRTRGEIAGDAAVVSWDSEASNPVKANLRVTDDGQGDVALPGFALTEDPYTTQLRHFLDVIRGNAQPIITADDGLAVLQVAEAVARSLATGEVVTLDDEEVAA